MTPTITSPPAATTPPTFGNSLDQLTDDTDSQPRYSVGNLVVGDIVNIQLTFTEDTVLAPFTFKIAIITTAGTAIADASQPTGFQAADVHTIAPANSFSWTWTVPAGITGQHYVQVW